MRRPLAVRAIAFDDLKGRRLIRSSLGRRRWGGFRPITSIYQMPKRAIEPDEMVKMYRDGATLQAVADVAGVSRERVRQIVRARGVPSGFAVAARLADAVGRYQDGASMREAARLAHVALPNLSEELRRRGLVRAPKPCGTLAAYLRGCRCAECRRANADRHAKWVSEKRGGPLIRRCIRCGNPFEAERRRGTNFRCQACRGVA